MEPSQPKQTRDDAMKFDLNELNQFSIESIQLEFMKTPLSERVVEIQGDFNLRLLGCRLISAIPFIPLHVDTIKFTGSFCYHVESFDSSESREVIPDQVLCFVGPALHQFVAAIPKHVVNIVFSLHHRKVLHDNQQLMNQICEGFTEVFHKIPANVCSLDFSEMRDFGYADNQYLSELYENLPATVKSIKLHKMRWGITVENHDQVVQAVSRNLRTLHLEDCDFLTAFPAQNPIHFFARVNPNLESLVLKGNKIGNYHLEHYLEPLFSSFPPRLKHLSLNENQLFNISNNDLNKLMKLLPFSLEHLEIANNFFLTLPTSVFSRLMNMLPVNIHTLSIFESDVSNATRQQIIDNFAILPPQIKTLKISGGQFLGLNMISLMLLLNQLPATVECLDFSDNQLNLVKLDELINLFAYLPVNVHRLKISNNHLCSLTSDQIAYIFQRLPYQIYELDLSQNGFDRLSFSKLNSLMAILPDGVINFGQDKITWRSDGKFVPFFPRPTDTLYRPVMKIRHQSCMSYYFVCLNQFMKKYQFDANIMINIFSNLIEPNEHKHGQMVRHMIYKAEYFKPQNKRVQENVVVAGGKHRLSFLSRAELDWSYCGLGNLTSVDSYKQLFTAIPAEIKRINLRHNGFIIHSSNMSCLSDALVFIPPHVLFLDMSANHFELQSKEYLQRVFSKLPATVQYVSFGQGRPVSLAQHLLRLDTPAYFLKILAREQPFMTKAKHLLDDYGQYGYWFLRLIFGYWNRKNLEEVTKCVFFLKHNFFKNTDDFLCHLENIPLSNESGALAKSIMALFKENQNMMQLAKVDCINPGI
jgi:hypothetical protein